MRNALFSWQKAFAVTACLFCCLVASTQSTTQKVSNTIANGAWKANQAKNAVGDTKEAVDDVKKMAEGIFGKKKKKDKEQQPEKPAVAEVKPAATPMMLITIANVEYAKLKELEEVLKSLNGVTSTSKKFSTASSSIEVGYGGKADELWELIPKEYKAMYDLKDLADGKITLEAKK